MAPAPRGSGGDIDDTAPFFRSHRRQDGLRAEEGRLQVHRDGPIELAFGEVIDAAHDGYAGIVDQNVDRTECRSDAIDHRCDGGGLRHVGRDRDRATACLLDVSHNRVGLIGVLAIVDRDGSTGFGERGGNRGADATRCTRHQCGVAVQFRFDGHDRCPCGYGSLCQFAQGRAAKASAIDLAPVADRHHQHNEPVVFDRGDDPVVADAIAPEAVPVAGQRLP
jgi:hypothetical protein